MIKFFQTLNKIWPTALAITVIALCAFLFKQIDRPQIIIETKPNPESITAHISGAVRTPGIYTLAIGARLDDLIRAAGGLSDDANADAINLARPVIDGEKVVISSAIVDPYHSAASASSASSDMPININTADTDQLCLLPGIGKAIAERIIEYRRDTPFMSREDIMQISGIGETLYERIKEMIVTGNE